MNIMVTGARGFIGKNLIAELKARNYEVYEVTRETTEQQIIEYCKSTRFVYHLAGVNRPEHSSEFMMGNYEFTRKLLAIFKDNHNSCPFLITSSIQAALDNDYGKSKKASEDIMIQYGKETGANTFIYRLPNVFGKWCKPNYNSVVATFCSNIACGKPIVINNPEHELSLVYIDDVINEFIACLTRENMPNNTYQKVETQYRVALSQIADAIYSFKKSREDLEVIDVSNQFTKKLYSTYLSYLPKDQFNYALKMNVDHRGSFTEFMKSIDRGQVSINISKPNIVKGNHWHQTKTEKFLVVSGHGVIRFRKIDTEEVVEYFVSGEKLEVVDIPPGYTHNIENLGQSDMVTVMWANEYFNPTAPDTYFMEV
ncbi:NAD-dependent epimerase/dehydratase family protein [Paenibacillus sp. 1P07SE]|uniref:polysaccharide biosynthesis C-terminal domain-containing protein n=1 Tax=Paenibacillus sp. 1P07SE TaxID=3132209 RepID=UPI0039A53217